MGILLEIPEPTERCGRQGRPWPLTLSIPRPEADTLIYIGEAPSVS